MLTIVSAGLQSTLQGAPRRGARHQGLPWAGPADPLSLALANRLVGLPAAALGVEITLGGFEARFDVDAIFALAGAPCAATLDGSPVRLHRSHRAAAGATLVLPPPETGMRTYLAVEGGMIAAAAFGSASTYLPARIGGLHGRSLQPGDVLKFRARAALLPALESQAALETPAALRLAPQKAAALRATPSAETSRLAPSSREALFASDFRVSRQVDRTGVRLDGVTLELRSDGRMKSAAAFPGLVQCPEDGAPIILGADAQTTGGYPRIASIARCDRHLIGQLRPGATVRLLSRTFEDATAELVEKSTLVRGWIPDFTF
ncbi:MAG: 5-oxoprolinase/urea amidolyase family protein [Alphaproteobacteria bacterium]|nr:5-oxoprolinase/urea amidolyase family protein [Alphaproteobacteria bacterium]